MLEPGLFSDTHLMLTALEEIKEIYTLKTSGHKLMQNLGIYSLKYCHKCQLSKSITITNSKYMIRYYSSEEIKRLMPIERS